MICRHCHKSNVNRPRGLCWGCFQDFDIRNLYPVTSKFRPDLHGVREAKPILEDTSDTDFEAALEAEYAKSPLWVASELDSDSEEYLLLVKSRELAGLPARHPGDKEPNLE